MASNLELKFATWQFNGKKRKRIYNKLTRFLDNGVPLPKALDNLYLHASDDGAKPKNDVAIILDQWRLKVAEGKKFGQAISGFVPESDRLVIEGGESAGELVVAIEKAVAINESSGKIRNTVIQGLAYPVMLVVAALALLVLIVRQVVPAFDAVLPREEWQGVGAQMAVVADFIDGYLLYGLAFVFFVIFAVMFSLPRWVGKGRLWADKIPPWSIYRLVLGSGFMLTISGMMRAGIAMPNALAMLSKGATPWYRQRISHTLRWVNEGHNLGNALKKTGYGFPDHESIMDLRAYADLNNFDEALEKMAVEWLNESVEKIEVQTAVLKNIGLFLLGGTFMWIYGGIFSLQQQISSALQ